MAELEQRNRSYIVWQDRAFYFYLAARLLIQRERPLWAPASFSATHAVELILKATLVYWDPSFSPKSPSHDLLELQRLTHKVKGGSKIRVPEYFCRYNSVSRYPYPPPGKNIKVDSLLDDLDRIFCECLVLVPFQFNSKVLSVLKGSDRSFLLILRRRNRQMRKLRRWFAKVVRK